MTKPELIWVHMKHEHFEVIGRWPKDKLVPLAEFMLSLAEAEPSQSGGESATTAKTYDF